MKIYTIYILLLLLLLSCTSRKGSSVQVAIDNFSTYNNPALAVLEIEYLQWVDSVLGVKSVKLIDNKNGIYQYNDTRFYWNRTFDYFLVYPSSFTHGEESDLGNGNHFVNVDSTICLNVYATYFDVFKDDYSLREWFNIMIDSEVEQGNRIVKKDITDHSYTIEGNTKSGRCFYSKAIYRKAYERDIIVTVKLEYIDSAKEQVEYIINKNINDFPYN
ncbi:hypothetical protein [Bacteroides thetaiotaomicron]|uniref:hypothetical protein n=1 Tax=Bacteroides thetaiotaomicron TaxID=818 RepID=UPI00356991D7